MTVEEDLRKEMTELVGTLKSSDFGEVEVLDGGVEADFDGDGDFALYLTLLLAQPDAPTWPQEDVARLREMILNSLRGLNFSGPVYVTLRPDEEEEFEEEDQLSLPIGR